MEHGGTMPHSQGLSDNSYPEPNQLTNNNNNYNNYNLNNNQSAEKAAH